MKNSVPISSDVWEEKKALIAALYKDEEWPLKQVIKKIRSENFNPSETQLRSRLKKWRVTKPSRQTRERTKESVRSPKTTSCANNNGSPNAQTRSRQPPTPAEVPATQSEWNMPNRADGRHSLPTMPLPFSQQEISTVWGPVSSHSSPLSSPGKSRVNSLASMAISTSSYEPSRTSSLVDSALLDSTPAMTPTFANSPYALENDSCLQTAVPTTTAVPPVQWAMPQWYLVPMETGSQAPSMPFYSTGPLTPPIDPMMLPMAPQTPEYHDCMKSWKRTLSSPYDPDLVSAKLQQPPKSLERKVSHSSNISTSQYPSGMVTPTSPFCHGQYPSVCSPGYPYSGPESLVHRSSIDL
ncbi:hypothetical protein BDW60DRAFT_70435 [Aspergillus nidulans var. acristatus]